MPARDSVKKCNRPTAKVKAATAGSATGSAFGVVICWVLTTAGFAPPTGVEGAIAVLCSTLFAGLAGYYKRPNAGTRVIEDDQGLPRTGRQIRNAVAVHRHRQVRAA